MSVKNDACSGYEHISALIILMFLNQHRAATVEILKLEMLKTWRTLIGVKLNNNRTQYSSSEIFWQCIQDTKRKIFSLCLFCEKLRFNHFAQRKSVKSNKS